MEMEYTKLKLTKNESCCTITICDEKTHHVLSEAMTAEIAAAVDEVLADKEIRVCILTGVGRMFIPGGNLKEMVDYDPVGFMEKVWNPASALLKKMRESKVVFIAAINGMVFGGGLEIAMGCDIRLAAASARFGNPEVGLGMTPCIGLTQILPRITGVDKALDLLATGRTYTAQEAEKLGVVTRVVDDGALMEETEKLAKQILKNAPYAVAAVKHCIYQSMETPLSEGLLYEGRRCAELFGQPDQKEGMSAFIEKRKARLSRSF